MLQRKTWCMVWKQSKVSWGCNLLNVENEQTYLSAFRSHMEATEGSNWTNPNFSPKTSYSWLKWRQGQHGEKSSWGEISYVRNIYWNSYRNHLRMTKPKLNEWKVKWKSSVLISLQLSQETKALQEEIQEQLCTMVVREEGLPEICFPHL